MPKIREYEEKPCPVCQQDFGPKLRADRRRIGPRYCWANFDRAICCSPACSVEFRRVHPKGTRRYYGYQKYRKDYCEGCGVGAQDVDHTLPVHHIDFNRHNNEPSNLRTLCFRCHMQAHGWQAREENNATA